MSAGSPSRRQRRHLFTTIGRTAYVEVGVPTHYTPEANALVDLAARRERARSAAPAVPLALGKPGLDQASAQRRPTGRRRAS